MPIFRLPTGLGYFADIPGCAGAEMVRNLEARFGPLAFHDPAHNDAPRIKRWSRTSPQHVGRATLNRLFPPDFFAASFVLVRHPVERLRAVYAFQRDVEGTIPASTDFHDWLEDVAERMEDEPWVFDNAVRPMVELVPDGADVFRLEDGIEAVTAWLDRVTGTTGPAIVAPAAGIAAPEPSTFDLERIAELYAADYARFDYDDRLGGTRPRLFGGSPRARR